MEQFFVIIAVIVFIMFRGAAGSRRRLPGRDPYEVGSPGGGPIDVVGTSRQKSLEAQQRAIEALRRWEEKQGLSGGAAGSGGSTVAPTVPSTARTRVARPANLSGRTTAGRKRREAYAEIARMLDPAELGAEVPRGARRFEVKNSREDVPAAAEPPPSWDATEVRAPRVRPAATEGSPSERRPADASGRSGRGKRGSSAGEALARLEGLPLAARAVVYAEILGPPRSAS